MTPKQIYELACNAGKEAIKKATPCPMVVEQHKNMLDDNSPVVFREVISGGVCGFAWINISPARGKFVTWLKKNNIGSKGYRGGYEIWVHEGGQSMELKEAYSYAFAKVLEENGISCYADSRMD